MICDSYLLDHRALALKSVYTDGFKSKIITTHGIYFSKLSAEDLLDKACIRYFSTKKGREQASRLLLKYIQKPPFLISNVDIGVAPTAASRNFDCVWIFNHRCTVKEVAKGQSIVTFVDGTSISVNASKHTISRQLHRLHTLLSYAHTIHRERELYIEPSPNYQYATSKQDGVLDRRNQKHDLTSM